VYIDVLLSVLSKLLMHVAKQKKFFSPQLKVGDITLMLVPNLEIQTRHHL